MTNGMAHIQLATRDTCTGCGACANVCPKSCISMVEDREGFLQPKIDRNQCIECHQCEHTCPILNREFIRENFETRAYAAINTDDEVLMQSSSGGVFYALAKWVIERGGVVFGARWNEKWEVIHDYAEDLVGIKVFMQSKYVQSIIGDTYKQAKDFLIHGRWVLFSGTPCQLGGLRGFLGKEYEKLIQVDLICHGVPSPGVWRKYLKDYVGNDHILSLNMRDKTEGWDGFQFFTTTTTTTTRREKQMENPYFRGFLKNVYLRKSCYSCSFLGLHRNTDLTLADFWGVKVIRPELWNKNGVSLVFAHTLIGESVLTQLDIQTKALTESEKTEAVESNPTMVQSWSESLNRKAFFAHYRWFSFRVTEPLIDKRLLIPRMIRKLKNLMLKFRQMGGFD